MKEYGLFAGKFRGGKANGKEWWEEIPADATQSPLKTLAITLFSIVSHAAEVEHLFSALGGIQGLKRVKLTVKNFKMLRILHANYTHKIQTMLRQ